MAILEDNEIDQHYVHHFEEFAGSFCLIAPSENVTNAIIFVHGFGGDALGTWSHFHQMVDDGNWDSNFSNTDLFFFQYSSIWERIQSSTISLLKFLDKVIFQPDEKHFVVELNPLFIDEELDVENTQKHKQDNKLSVLPAERSYRRVFLVGHSEGGVVIRNGVRKKFDGNSPLMRSQLLLFAPAIGGYAPAGLLGMIANSPFFGKVLDAVLHAAPAYQDMKKPELLKEIRQKTEKKAREAKRSKDTSRSALTAFILWGSKDPVVNPNKYDHDDEDFENCNHIDICKPSLGYQTPIELLSKRINDSE